MESNPILNIVSVILESTITTTAKVLANLFYLPKYIANSVLDSDPITFTIFVLLIFLVFYLVVKLFSSAIKTLMIIFLIFLIFLILGLII